MKTLLLMRHAKADARQPEQDDFDRPLAPTGRADAARVAGFLSAEGLAPALVICSAARRAEETWACLAQQLGDAIDLKMDEDLYSAMPAGMLQAVREAPAAASPLLLIGHNPGMEMLARSLAGHASVPAACKDLNFDYPSSGLAVIEFDIETWPDAAPGEGRLTHFITPKTLA
jgi:phosphohistidine phosphatase